FIFATPPCQGVSLVGKNKNNDQMLKDRRNFLIFDVFDIIDAVQPKAIMIENVARFMKMKYLYHDKLVGIEDIIKDKYSHIYNMDFQIFNAVNYGVPQNRPRAIIRLWKNEFYWGEPKAEQPITVKEAIGHLPSLESGEKSSIKNHYARKHTDEHIKWLKHTPTGKSAF